MLLLYNVIAILQEIKKYWFCISFEDLSFQDSGTITHVASGMCLDKADEMSNGFVVAKKCNGKDSQKWTFEHYLDL